MVDLNNCKRKPKSIVLYPNGCEPIYFNVVNGSQARSAMSCMDISESPDSDGRVAILISENEVQIFDGVPYRVTHELVECDEKPCAECRGNDKETMN